MSALDPHTGILQSDEYAKEKNIIQLIAYKNGYNHTIVDGWIGETKMGAQSGNGDEKRI